MFQPTRRKLFCWLASFLPFTVMSRAEGGWSKGHAPELVLHLDSGECITYHLPKDITISQILTDEERKLGMVAKKMRVVNGQVYWPPTLPRIYT